ncbi:cassette chromosome recombinase A [Agrococcus casei LMG 22410]|uniref:Cassette chromosome recombinase A n=1 Tax=Agrococcus casei LMG 22410 TaxID=1255656 RepID=A0A1R4G3Y2_9MICO|nr:cassette chromosome recombinase A [Agrococcus casei LMG 22410]
MTVLAGPDDDWNDRVREAEERLAALRYRLDEAAEQYAEGAISLAMLSNVEQRLNPQIEQAAREAVPPVADAAVLDLISADDVRAAWERLDLLEQRRLIKMLLEIRIEKSQLMGGIFDYGRIKIAPRFVAPETYNWRRAA